MLAGQLPYEVANTTICEGACGCVLLLWSDRCNRAHRTLVRECTTITGLANASGMSFSSGEKEEWTNHLCAHLEEIELRRPLDVEDPNASQAC